MEGLSGAVFGQKLFEVYGPMALGWIAWVFTMFYLRGERKRYQDLVILIVQYFTKVNMLGMTDHEPSPLDSILNHRVSPPDKSSTRPSTRRRTDEDEGDEPRRGR